MLRTQLYLPEEIHQELTFLADKMGVSMAAVIRKMLQVGLREKEIFFAKGNDLLLIAKLGIKGGPKDLSARLDSYLYK
ncbi:hypothetical protein FJZ40_03020 [Candidatus Shapirobacteria bacterium]|nr:hypothetical protein [Candidatus Shapirobacteria bacterium]